MTVTFSPARVVAIVLLAFVTVWYIGVMSHNAVPHGRDRVRQEQPLGHLPAVP